MADCGTAGSALDRVASAASGGNKQAVTSLLGHAAIGGNQSAGAMPMAPPSSLAGSSSHHGVQQPMPMHVQQQQPLHYPQHALDQAWQQQPHPMAAAARHHPLPPPMHMMRQPHFQLHAPHPFAMESLLRQQQQGMPPAETQVHAKTGDSQTIPITTEQSKEEQLAELKAYLESLEENSSNEDDVVLREVKERIHELIHNYEQQQKDEEPTLDNWHDNLKEDFDNDGQVRGATMDELAAAWAQAEADYDADEAANLASAATTLPLTEEELYPYSFSTRIEQNNSEQQQNEQQRDLLQEGLDFYRQGEIALAIQSLETLLQTVDADNAKAWFVLGKCHAENDLDRNAIACLERAVERDPYYTEALLALGVSYVNELNHTKALECLKQWITHNHKYAHLEETHDLYGGGGDATNELDQVQGLLLNALQAVDNADFEIEQALGVVYNVSRDYDAAVASFRKALEQNPHDHGLWNKLGATLANSNQSELALEAYQRALELRPKYARCWLNMAISHSNLKNYDEAARCYLQTLSLNPAAEHCWSYLRIALSCAEKWDLLPLVAEQDLSAFQEHFDFVIQ